jgi:hypothetical protein
MKKVLITAIIVFALVYGAMWLYNQSVESTLDEGMTIEEAEILATEWVENTAPTYLYDGSELTLDESQETDDYSFVFSFTSSSAGYGDRTDQMTAQVITPHTTVVTVKDNQVVSAITDEVFSEMTGEMLTTEFSVFFLQQEEVVPVTYTLPTEEYSALTVLETLLAGPTTDEYTTAINEGVEVLDLTIEDGIARVDFSATLDEGVAGSATVNAIRNQIEQTLLQFSDEVIISVEGETEEVLQP